MFARILRTAACAAVLFILLCPPGQTSAFSLIENIVQSHPFYSLQQKAATGSCIETRLGLNEWARNIDSPEKLLIEDRSGELRAAYRLNPNFLIEAALFDHYRLRNCSKSITFPDDYPVRLDMANANNEAGASLGFLAHKGTDHSISAVVHGVNSPVSGQVNATFAGITRLLFAAPFLSFRWDFPDLYSVYTVRTQISSNPFQYRTIFNRQTWLFGTGLYTPWQQRPIVLTRAVQHIDPKYIYADDDSLALRADLRADLIQLPCDIGRATTTGSLGFFTYNGLLDLYYLNVSSIGYSTVVSNMPAQGTGFGALLQSRMELFSWLDLEATVGHASIGLDSVSGKKFNLAKYEVISEGNYLCSGSASLTAWMCALGANIKFMHWNTIKQSLGLLRIYPGYALDWEKRPLFTSSTNGTLESEIIFADFLVYRGAWEFRRGAWAARLCFDQGIPLRTRYTHETSAPTNSGQGGKKADSIIGLEQAMLKITYWLPDRNTAQ